MRAVLCLLLVTALADCKDWATSTLYGAHPNVEGWKIHVAPFDAEGDLAPDNVDNCDKSAALS